MSVVDEKPESHRRGVRSQTRQGGHMDIDTLNRMVAEDAALRRR